MAYLKAILAGSVLVFVAIFVVFVVEPAMGTMGDESQFVFLASGFCLGGLLWMLYQVFARIADGPRKASTAPNPFVEQRRIDDRKRARQGRRPDMMPGPIDTQANQGATVYTLKSARARRDRPVAPSGPEKPRPVNADHTNDRGPN